MITPRTVVLCSLVAALALPGVAHGQKSLADVLGREIRAPGQVPTGKSHDTITIALYYSFFWRLSTRPSARVPPLEERGPPSHPPRSVAVAPEEHQAEPEDHDDAL